MKALFEIDQSNTITITRLNVELTNEQDTHYLNLKHFRGLSLIHHLSTGGNIRVEFIQYKDISKKRISKPIVLFTIEIDSLEKLGLRTTTPNGIRYYRYKINGKIVNKTIIEQEEPNLSIGSICTGMGALPTSLQDSNIDFDFKYSIEIDKHCHKTIKKNFPQLVKQYDDIFDIDPNELEQVDLLEAGFPCGTFSMAGLRCGFNDEDRGTIIFKIVEILVSLISNNKAPKIVLLENVLGLLSHDKINGEFQPIYGVNQKGTIGRSLHIIEIQLFSLLSHYYDISWRVENTLNYGIPHNRDRWFCVMTAKTSKYDFDFNKMKKIPLTTTVKDFLENESGINPKSYYTKNRFIPNNKPKGRGLLSVIGDIENINYGQSKRVLSIDGPSSCLTTGETSKFLIGYDKNNEALLRKLTIKEKLGLQAFPRWFKFDSTTSQTQRNKQLGNTISVNVLNAIWEVMFDTDNTTTINQTITSPESINNQINIPAPINNVGFFDDDFDMAS